MSTVATEIRNARIGIALALYPSDPSVETEIQRAPDSSGSPDVGAAETIAVVPPGHRTYVDIRSGGVWHYRTRHVRAGATSSSWTDWVKATPKQIPYPLPNVPDVGGWIIKQGRLGSTDGAIVLDAPNEQIRVGAATDPTTGLGIFLGRDGTNPDKYDLRVGNPAGAQLWWDHSEELLKYTGLLEANGIRYGPLHVAATDRATSGSGTTNLETFSIPAGAMGSAGGVRLHMLVNIEGTNNTKSVAMVIGGSSIVNLIFGPSFEGRVSFDVNCFNTTPTTQRTHIAALPNGGTGIVQIASSSADTAGAVDFDIDGFVTNAGDTVTLEVSFAELVAPGA